MIIAFASGPELDKKQPMKDFLFTGYRLPGDTVRAPWHLYVRMCNVGMVGVIFGFFFPLRHLTGRQALSCFLLHCLNSPRNSIQGDGIEWLTSVLPKPVFFLFLKSFVLSQSFPHYSKMKTLYNINKFFNCPLLWWELRRYILIWSYYIFGNAFTWILHSVNCMSNLYGHWSLFGLEWYIVLNSRWQ